jgi:RNA polymerase sigma-70 factor (ECF subfamily)
MVTSFTQRLALTGLPLESIRVADASETLVREHARFVFRIAYSVLRNHHDAEDVTQETFLRVLRRRGGLAGVEDPRAWIGTIAFRLAVQRRQGPAAEDVDVTADHVLALRSTGADVDEVLQREQLGAIVWRLVATLPPDLRHALLLSTVTELTSAQAGRILGVPEGTVRSRAHRARQLLREKVAARLAARVKPT